jgi:hypothetical protein
VSLAAYLKNMDKSASPLSRKMAVTRIQAIKYGSCRCHDETASEGLSLLIMKKRDVPRARMTLKVAMSFARSVIGTNYSVLRVVDMCKPNLAQNKEEGCMLNRIANVQWGLSLHLNNPQPLLISRA